MTIDIKRDLTLTQLPPTYTDLVIEKSNLLLRANMFEAQRQFDEAAELFAKSAALEAQLAATAQQYGQPDMALIHLISEMSCWAAAGDTYHAFIQGKKVLTFPTLTSAQKTHITDFIERLNQRRHSWMASWSYPATASA